MTTIIYDLHAQVEAAHLHPLRHASINAERLNVTPTPKLGTNSQSQRLSVFPVVRHHREYFLENLCLVRLGRDLHDEFARGRKDEG